jgi:prolyl-tRNA synthetase
MKQQHFFSPTLRDIPADAEVSSHQLMLRAGLIRQLASGIYTFLPLGQRVLRKLQEIIRQEMDKAGAQELLMPAIQPAEIWQESGRWEVYGPELMRLHDRHERPFALGPTHEEVVTGLIRDDIKSYKRLPLTVYQIQTKFRDEKRPRFGVLRSREFMMKDAYSFDIHQKGLDASYNFMYQAYHAIFTRCGLNYRAVEADSGAIGGTDTHEFMVLSDIGEDTIAYSTESDYAANIEMAPVIIRDYEQVNLLEQAYESIDTPDAKSIEDVVQLLSIDIKQTIKAVALSVDGQPVLALVRGDYSINEIKAKNVLSAKMVELLSEDRIAKELLSFPGFIGPIDLDNDKVRIIADYSVRGLCSAVVGANQKDKHYQFVKPERDFSIEQYADLREAVVGDPSPCGRGTLAFAKGIEVGHVFKLGTKYSEAMGASFLDEQGKEQLMIMGCYGIGVSRTIAAVIEQHHDENGICWPLELAPFHIHLIPVNVKDETQIALADQLYDQLLEQGYEVLYDNRNERAGVKFKDADLIGIPVRIVVGKKAEESMIELKIRATGESEELHINGLLEQLRDKLKRS